MQVNDETDLLFALWPADYGDRREIFARGDAAVEVFAARMPAANGLRYGPDDSVSTVTWDITSVTELQTIDGEFAELMVTLRCSRGICFAYPWGG